MFVATTSTHILLNWMYTNFYFLHILHLNLPKRTQMYHKKTLAIIIIGLFSFAAQAQIVINEYSASNLHSFTDNYGRTEDWIELYNTSNQTVNVGGWHLSDKANKPGKYEIPEGTMIPGGGHLLFWCSGRDIVCDGHYHTNFKLAQSEGKDIVMLTDPDENVINQYEMELTLVEHSRCRQTDGSSNFVVSTAPTPGESNNGSAQVQGYTAAPSMDMAAGFYDGPVTVTITNNEPNSILKFTLDGDNPTLNDLTYSAPITVTETTVIKAQAFSNDGNILPGKMDFNTYFINEDHTLAVFSVAADQVINLANGQGSLIPIGSLEYFNTDKEREAVGFGSLNRHGQDSWILDHRSLDWVTRDEMGYTKEINAPLFADSDRQSYQKFMFRNSGDDNYPANDDFNHVGSTHIRDEYVQTLSREGGMELDTRLVERVVLYLNGRYWGVYGMRERPVDHDYTDEYYDQGKYDIHYLSTWFSTETEYGGQDALVDWVSIRDFVLENDMSDPENYQRVDDEINLTSLSDYFIANLFVVAKDWLNYNTGWWRGLNPEGDHKKWGYILWDLDATFGYYINYTGIPNEEPNALPCDINQISNFMDSFFGDDELADYPMPGDNCNSILNGSSPYPADDPNFNYVINQNEFCCENWSGNCDFMYNQLVDAGGATCFDDGDQHYFGNTGKHEKILLKLQEESETFRQLYFSRMADLRNTVYSCENMNETLDRMLAVIRPEMPRQIERWGGTMSEWNQNVDLLYDFVNARCGLIDEGMTSCYDLAGPYEVTLMAEPIGIGEIDFNTLDIETFPWTGEYFGGMDNKIHANVWNENEDDWVFSHWESSAGSEIGDITAETSFIRLTSADTLTAVFTNISSVDENALDIDFRAYPNPAYNQLVVEYNLEASTDMKIELHNSVGQLVQVFDEVSGRQASGFHKESLTLDKSRIQSGLYILKVRAEDLEKNIKISILD